MKIFTEEETVKKDQLKKIITFLKTKQKKLFNATGLVYMTEEDYADIRKFTAEQIYEIYYSIKKALEYRILKNSSGLLLNSNFCPFCIINETHPLTCEESMHPCQYKVRHGCCMNTGSTYRNIITKCKDNNITFTVNEITSIYNKLNKVK